MEPQAEPWEHRAITPQARETSDFIFSIADSLFKEHRAITPQARETGDRSVALYEGSKLFDCE